MPKRLDDGRREELLDGVMEIIVARGFSGVSTLEMARELHCSVSSLYKIAPSKESLVALAIRRWGQQTFEYAEACGRQGKSASDRARNYFKATAERLAPQSREFRRDMERFEASRSAYRVLSDTFVDRFDELLDQAVEAGDIRPVNIRFLGYVMRQIAVLVRDEDVLMACGLTAAQAGLEVDGLLWEGLKPRQRSGEGTR